MAKIREVVVEKGVEMGLRLYRGEIRYEALVAARDRDMARMLTDEAFREEADTFMHLDAFLGQPGARWVDQLDGASKVWGPSGCPEPTVAEVLEMEARRVPSEAELESEGQLRMLP